MITAFFSQDEGPLPYIARIVFRQAQGPLPFRPINKEIPTMACDHVDGIEDGNDRPLHLFDDVLHPSRMHKCSSDYVSQIVGSTHR